MVLYINNMRSAKNYSQEIEEVLVQNLEGYFAGARASTEDDIGKLKDQIESQNQRSQQLHDEQRNLSRKQQELRGMVDQEQGRIEAAKDRLNAILKFISVVVILLVEAKIASFFIKTVQKSVQVITAPMPDASDPSAGAAMGSGFLNLLAIPVKAVAGVIVVAVVFFVLKAIFDGLKSEDKMAEHLPELNNVTEQKSNSQKRSENIANEIKSSIKKQKKLEDKLAFYKSIDVKRPETFLAWAAGEFQGKGSGIDSDTHKKQTVETTNMEVVAGEKKTFCTNCGAQVKQGSAFCISCGSPL
jgi:hypothetical protein